MASVTVKEELCKGCGLCVGACPKQIMKLDSSLINQKGYHIAHCTDQNACIGCAFCAIMCPEVAILVKK